MPCPKCSPAVLRRTLEQAVGFSSVTAGSGRNDKETTHGILFPQPTQPLGPQVQPPLCCVTCCVRTRSSCGDPPLRRHLTGARRALFCHLHRSAKAPFGPLSNPHTFPLMKRTGRPPFRPPSAPPPLQVYVAFVEGASPVNAEPPFTAGVYLYGSPGFEELLCQSREAV